MRGVCWTADHADGHQAVMAFNGDVYQGLDARSLGPDDLDWLQRHLRPRGAGPARVRLSAAADVAATGVVPG